MAEKQEEINQHNSTVKGALVKFVKHSHLFEKKEEKHEEKKEEKSDEQESFLCIKGHSEVKKFI